FPSKVVVVRGTPPETVEILLEKPRSVEVELVSHDGQPLGEPIFVHAGRGGSTERGTPLGAQRFRIDNLPTGEVLLTAFGQGGMASRLHDTREPFAKLTLGGPTRVRAKFARPPESADSTFALAVATSGSSADLTRVELGFDDAGKSDSTLWGFPFGAYDAWLEQRSEDDWNVWSRVGTAQPVVLDAEHLSAQVELHL
ncbi:MAG TPA: hypothetical protein VM509_12165, partial [Planctomycetota bacterium]|nr:hypothetical protein [Planctomycetota bacterium]